MLACESGNIPLVEYLRSMEGCPLINEGDKAGCTPLYVAIYNHRVDMVKYLMEEASCDITK